MLVKRRKHIFFKIFINFEFFLKKGLQNICQLWYNSSKRCLHPSSERSKSINTSCLSGKYRIVSVLGQGNSSHVFLAEHRKLKAYRAVKCIDKKAQTIQPQLILEADILKNLKHPGIPTIYDVEEDDNTYYIIEEYIQGQSLETFMFHQDCISIDTVIYMTLQICDVIRYLHEQKPEPVIYQDLKPEHIILCGKRIVLIDFGISSYITSNGNTFQNFGTEGFAPPEKYQGIPCDVRTDIYGVGKVLAYMAAKVPKEEFRFLKPFIKKATAYAREERYATIDAFMADLQKTAADGFQIYQQTNNKHLLTEIAVAGTQQRVGTTHIAISLTCFFNQNNQENPYSGQCIYQECHKSECMRQLAKEDGAYMTNDGLVACNKFRGMPYYGEGIAACEQTDGMYIQDYGIYLHDILEDDRKLIVVMGSRPWECEYAENILRKISLRKNLVLICNYGNSIKAKNMAKMYRHRVYCFPLDKDPFRMTGEKRKLFQKLLKQEGW